MRACDQITHLTHLGGGLIARRDHPELSGGLDWLLRRDLLRPVLPGVFSTPDLVGDPLIRMRAALLRHPDAVLLGGAAARLSYWPEAPLTTIEVAVNHPVADARGFAFTRRRVPPEVWVERDGLRYSTPALTAIDLATAACADPIDRALRMRVATVAGMHEALRLTPNRRGNSDRLRLLLDSRDAPWSAAERRGHRLLRQARVSGWVSNHPVVLAGTLYYIDIAFRGARLAVEIDGRDHENKADLFESDRWRQNALVNAGWRVLRFTWSMIHDHPEVVLAAIRRGLRT